VVRLHCATFSPARPGRAKTRPCPLASTALSCAFCEQRSRPLRPPLRLPSLKGLGNSSEGVVGLSSTARVQRGPSQAARCASKEDGPSIPFPPSLPKDREAFRKGAVAGFNCATFSPARPGRAKTRPCPGEGPLLLPLVLYSHAREWPDHPLLRASNEHRLTVRVLRARRMVWPLPTHPSQAACCASKETGHRFLPLPPTPPKGLGSSRGDGEVGLNCAHGTSTVSSCAFCEQRGRPLHPLIHRPSSILHDTPLQSSPNPSETDPYPSTPSSSDPRSDRYPAKSHRPESACRCASQTPI